METIAWVMLWSMAIAVAVGAVALVAVLVKIVIDFWRDK